MSWRYSTATLVIISNAKGWKSNYQSQFRPKYLQIQSETILLQLFVPLRIALFPHSLLLMLVDLVALDRRVRHPMHTHRHLAVSKLALEVDIPYIRYDEVEAYAWRLLTHVSDHCNFGTQFSDLA